MNEQNQNSQKKNTKEIIRDFWLSSFAVNNRTTIVLLMFLILITGIGAYQSMPKENFPEINIPTIYIGMTYPGNSPLDMENLITRHVEKQLNTISGVSKIKSSIIQDFSTTIVEFDFDTEVSDALVDVKDAVDKARSDLPSDMDIEPNIFEMDFASAPVININISGDKYTLERLKEYAETLEDQIEMLPQISKVEIRGAIQKEVKIEVDKTKMEGLEISFRDIEDAIGYENSTISAGDLLVNEHRRSIRILGEFQAPKLNTDPTIEEQIGNIIIKSQFQQTVKLRDIAEIKFEEKEADSYARIFGKPVISLDVMKRSGENLLDAVAEIKAIVAKADKAFPKDLTLTITNDTSKQTESMLSNLQNSIISGVILVVLVLIFFLGLRNALFVGVAIPLSMVMSFLILNLMGVTLNMMVLFSLILALGMLVDNGIVVVENIYRFLEEGNDLVTASKLGVGEVAVPIIASTLTTLAAFVTMIFWDGIMGEFMKYLPITLIIVLSSSLFVALVINPVLTSFFMKIQNLQESNKPKKMFWIITIIILLLFIPLSIYGVQQGKTDIVFMANMVILLIGIILLNIFVFEPMSKFFQTKLLVVLENAYSKFINWVLSGWKPVITLFLSFVMLVGTLGYFFTHLPTVEFFPQTSPQYVNVLIDFPTGTDIEKTNTALKKVEDRLIKGLEKYGFGGDEGHIEAILTNIGTGTIDPNSGRAGEDQGVKPNNAKITISFVEYQERTKGTKYEPLDAEAALLEIEEIVGEIPGATVTTGRPPDGPPTGPPINIAISGVDYEELIKIKDEVQLLIKKSGVKGLDDLKTDLDNGKPELIINVNRDAARTFGVSTSQIAGDLRTALFGKEISKYKEKDEDFPIMLRLNDEQRYNLEDLKNVIITFRDQADGKIKQIPVSAVADIEYSSSIGKVRRVGLDRVITLYSSAVGYNANEIIAELQPQIEEQIVPHLKEGYLIDFTGEQEEQAKSMAFLSKALMISVFLIFLIIVTQFNSISAPIIIMITVGLSLIGVFLGLNLFGDSFVVIMTMIGIISLAGVVVNNAIVLIDFTFLTRDRLMAENGLKNKSQLPRKLISEAIVTAGKTRLRPVLLTAITTVLGLIPLAIGFNVNFYTLIAEFDGQFYMGGDNKAMWGPLSWTVIYGLSFATFLTLVIVPILILLFDRVSYRFLRFFRK